MNIANIPTINTHKSLYSRDDVLSLIGEAYKAGHQEACSFLLKSPSSIPTLTNQDILANRLNSCVSLLQSLDHPPASS